MVSQLLLPEIKSNSSTWSIFTYSGSPSYTLLLFLCSLPTCPYMFIIHLPLFHHEDFGSHMSGKQDSHQPESLNGFMTQRPLTIRNHLILITWARNNPLLVFEPINVLGPISDSSYPTWHPKKMCIGRGCHTKTWNTGHWPHDSVTDSESRENVENRIQSWSKSVSEETYQRLKRLCSSKSGREGENVVKIASCSPKPSFPSFPRTHSWTCFKASLQWGRTICLGSSQRTMHKSAALPIFLSQIQCQTPGDLVSQEMRMPKPLST